MDQQESSPRESFLQEPAKDASGPLEPRQPKKTNERNKTPNNTKRVLRDDKQTHLKQKRMAR